MSNGLIVSVISHKNFRSQLCRARLIHEFELTTVMWFINLRTNPTESSRDVEIGMSEERRFGCFFHSFSVVKKSVGRYHLYKKSYFTFPLLCPIGELRIKSGGARASTRATASSFN